MEELMSKFPPMGHESFSVRKMKPRSRELAIYANALPLAYTLSPRLNFHFETGAQELSRLSLNSLQLKQSLNLASQEPGYIGFYPQALLI